MSKLTLKNTKQEILDALHEAEKKLKERQTVISAPAAAAEEERITTVVTAAAEDVKADIFSEEMKSKFENLQEAIRVQEERLKVCYGVEKTLIDMTVAINASKQAQMDVAAELEATQAKAKAVADELNAQNERLNADLAIARNREEAEYQYNLERSRKIETDKFSDKMEELAKQKTAAEAVLADLKADAKAITEMQTRMDGLDAELEAKFQEGVEAGKKEAGKEYGYKTALTDKEHAFEIRERDGKIARLEHDLTEKAAKIESLEAKLDAAYAQLRDLATKTVESSGGLKVLTTSGDSVSSRK